jgi:hypothetical protein
MTMATVTLNAEERDILIDDLVNDDACCFEEEEREVLNSLSDRTLARLTLNAKRTFNEENEEEPPLLLQTLNFGAPAFDRPGGHGGAVPNPQYGSVKGRRVSIPGFNGGPGFADDEEDELEREQRRRLGFTDEAPLIPPKLF